MIDNLGLIEKEIFDIVYGTIEKYQKDPNFRCRVLEGYDNWKDTIVERFMDFTIKGD